MATDLNYYELLELTPQASSEEIHNAYRQKSKIFHPDTTTLPKDVAVNRFQLLNEAYNILSCPDLRKQYDYQISMSQVKPLSPKYSQRTNSSLTPSFVEIQERPLSPGELFALLILVITFVACLVLALFLGIARGEMMLREVSAVVGIPTVRYLGFLRIHLC